MVERTPAIDSLSDTPASDVYEFDVYQFELK